MKILLFDGVCNLCNGTINYIIKRDKENQFKFASLQSDYAKEVLKGSPFLNLSTMVLIEDENIYTRSTAVLRVFKELKGYKWVKALLWMPASLRDVFYKLVAYNRYTLFGRQESCLLPSKELLDRFIQ